MAAFKTELFTIEDILNFYEQHEEAAFKIFAGNKPDAAYCRFEFVEDDKPLGTEMLQNNLLALKNNTQNTNQYLLQIIKKARKVKNGIKAVDFVNVTFQLNDNSITPYMQGSFVAGVNDTHRLEAAIEKMQMQNKQMIEALQQRISELEDEEEDEEDTTGGNFIAGLVNNPEVQTMIIGALSKLFQGQNSNSMNKNAQINGINENLDNETKLKAAIEILKVHDISLADDLTKLANIAETNPKQFAFLLSMLRNY